MEIKVIERKTIIAGECSECGKETPHVESVHNTGKDKENIIRAAKWYKWELRDNKLVCLPCYEEIVKQQNDEKELD